MQICHGEGLRRITLAVGDALQEKKEKEQAAGTEQICLKLM